MIQLKTATEWTNTGEAERTPSKEKKDTPAGVGESDDYPRV